MSESLFNKVGSLRPATLLKKETLVQVLSCEFCQISKNTFFKEHLQATASVVYNKLFLFLRYIEFNRFSTLNLKVKNRQTRNISSTFFLMTISNIVDFCKTNIPVYGNICYPQWKHIPSQYIFVFIFY